MSLIPDKANAPLYPVPVTRESQAQQNAVALLIEGMRRTSLAREEAEKEKADA